MLFLQYEPYNLPEHQKVVSFCRTQGMLLEEWNDNLIQIFQRAYAVFEDILPMIVVSPIAVYISTLEELLQQFKRCPTALALRHHKLAEYLIPDSPCGGRVAEDAYGKASLAIDKPYHPSFQFLSFLLIACTCAFFTGYHMVALYLMSSEYARILRCSSI